ncbi:MAG: hypothetical protein DMD99_06375 [Candidatus Rokuibacteriota bacterium]|nr:MAG: hypothetical protein DMD99_06375 [Candidatus Rokubacteria bacterium]
MWICASTTSMACSFPVWTSAGTVSLAEILAVFKRRETPGGERAPWLPHWSMIRGGTARALAHSRRLAGEIDGEESMSRTLAAGAVFAFALVGATTGAGAQGLVTTQKLSAALANELVGDSVATCAQKGYTVTAVVVDLDGVRQALLRGNGAPIHTLDNAFYKAYSAASLTLARKEDSTKAVADRVAKNPPTTVPQTPLPNVTYAVGGVTIMAGGKAIGAIGVSGAPGGQFDEECARAAIAKIQERMK